MTDDVFYLTQGDRLPDITRILLDEDGTPIDLTNAVTVELRLGDHRRTAVGGGACTVTNAAAGEVTYAFTAADTASPGTLQGKYVITWPGALAQTVPANGTVLFPIDKAIPALP